MRRGLLSLGALLLVVATARARDLEDILEEKGVIGAVEANEVKAAKEKHQAPALPPLPDWLSKVTFSGDVRVRNESFFREDTPTRIRQRFRLRFGAKAKANDQTELGFRVASGTPGDPISNNQTFDDTFTVKNVGITTAYVKLTPTTMIGMNDSYVTLMAGKFDMPFFQATRMQFDPDLTPEGFYEQIALFKAAEGPVRLLALNLGQWIFEEMSTRGDGALFAFQGLANLNVADGVFANLGFADYLYHEEGLIARKFATNPELSLSNSIVLSDGSVVAGRRFTAADFEPEVEGEDALEIVGFGTEFHVLNPNAEVTIATGMPAWPLRVFGDFVWNTEADDDDKGFQLGAGIGGSKDPGDVSFQYAYQRLETDAVVSAFSDSDFGRDGGTNTEGHILQAGYVLHRSLSLLSTAWIVEPIDEVRNPDTEFRWQVDLIARF